MKNKILIVSLIALFIGLTAQIASANPLEFVPTVQTSSVGTSTTALVSPAATSTLTFDTYSAGRPKPSEGATLLLQSTASSTSSVLNIAFEYSQDGIDWYQDNLINTFSTSSVISISQINSYSWVAATTARTSKAISLRTPTRFVRAVIGGSGATSSVWAQIVPVRQISE